MQSSHAASAAYSAVVSSPIGGLAISVLDGRLRQLRILPRPFAELPPVDSITQAVVEQLDRYFGDPSWLFDLPVGADGTRFQKRVWETLRSIPPGRPITYGALAERLGTGARAVGSACKSNPIPIVVPCHRVVGAGGLGGFMGASGGSPLAIKQWLLAHERADLP